MTSSDCISAISNDRFTVSVNLAAGGGLAIISQGGDLARVAPIPKTLWRNFFDRRSVIVDLVHFLPSVDQIDRVVIALQDKNTLTSSRSGPGLLYRLLEWLKIPTVVAQHDWLEAVLCANNSAQSARALLRQFPADRGFEDAYRDEGLAQAALLAWTAMAHPQWSGIALRRHDCQPGQTEGESNRHLLH